MHWLVCRSMPDQWKVMLNQISRRHLEMEILMKTHMQRVTILLKKLCDNGKILKVGIARVGPNFYSKLAWNSSCSSWDFCEFLRSHEPHGAQSFANYKICFFDIRGGILDREAAWWPKLWRAGAGLCGDGEGPKLHHYHQGINIWAWQNLWNVLSPLLKRWVHVHFGLS